MAIAGPISTLDESRAASADATVFCLPTAAADAANKFRILLSIVFSKTAERSSSRRLIRRHRRKSPRAFLSRIWSLPTKRSNPGSASRKSGLLPLYARASANPPKLTRGNVIGRSPFPRLIRSNRNQFCPSAIGSCSHRAGAGDLAAARVSFDGGGTHTIEETEMNSPMAAAARHSFALSLATVLAFVIGVCTGAQIASAASANRQALRGACMADYQTLCPRTPLGGGRVIACLQRNIDKLSLDCRNALAECQGHAAAMSRFLLDTALRSAPLSRGPTIRAPAPPRCWPATSEKAKADRSLSMPPSCPSPRCPKARARSPWHL